MSLVGKKIGNYEITRLIGSGGMGTVYHGQHPLIGKKVAVKVLHAELTRAEEMITRFFHEAKAANDIGHPNIVDVIDFGRIEDEGGEVVYLIMEYLEGESLKHRLRQRRPSPGEVVRIVDQIADALAASHAKHVVHRDLKPDNIHLVERAGDPLFVKVLDFGIAKLLDAPEGNVTRTGTVLGTPEYMAPEQCEGMGAIDARTDIYALGAMLYEMLTGAPPFAGGLREVLMAHLTQPVPEPITRRADVHPGLAAIAMRCLEKDKARRYQHMSEVREALRATGITPIYGGASAPHGPPDARTAIIPHAVSEATPPASPGRRRGVLWGSLGAAVALLIGGIAAVMLLRRDGGPPAASPPTSAATAAGATTGATVTSPRPATTSPSPATPHPVTPSPATPPVARTEIRVDSQPDGAEVTRAGFPSPLGKTPLQLEIARDEPDFDLRLSRSGYQPLTVTVRTARPQDIEVDLRALPAEAGAFGVNPPSPTAGTPPAARLPGTARRAVPAVENRAGRPAAKEPRKRKSSGDSDTLMTPQF